VATPQRPATYRASNRHGAARYGDPHFAAAYTPMLEEIRRARETRGQAFKLGGLNAYAR